MIKLLEKQNELRKQLNQINIEIDTIRHNCKHERYEYTGRSKDEHGRNYSDCKCLDCLKVWSER